jgi:hypothetical protein
MSGVGGVAATLGEVQDDAGQRITGDITEIWYESGAASSGALGHSTQTGSKAANGTSGVLTIELDTANSTSPNTAKTDDVETRVKAIVEGAGYIIVMAA